MTWLMQGEVHKSNVAGDVLCGTPAAADINVASMLESTDAHGWFSPPD